MNTIKFLQGFWRPLSGVIAALCLAYIGMVQWILTIWFVNIKAVDPIAIGFITTYLAWCFSNRTVEKLKNINNIEKK